MVWSFSPRGVHPLPLGNCGHYQQYCFLSLSFFLSLVTFRTEDVLRFCMCPINIRIPHTQQNLGNPPFSHTMLHC